MSGITINISVVGDGGAFLGQAAGALTDMSRPMASLASSELLATRDRFDAEKSPQGVPWIKSVRAAAIGGRTLFHKGALRASISQDSGSDFAQVGVLQTAGAAKYAARHNFGGTFRSGFSRAKPNKKGETRQGPGKPVTTIKRQFIGEDGGTRGRIDDIFGNWIATIFAGSDGKAGVSIT